MLIHVLAVTGGINNKEWAHILAGDETNNPRQSKLPEKPQPLHESNLNANTPQQSLEESTKGKPGQVEHE